MKITRQLPVAALTGAGISAESGVPTFRGEDGLWRNYRPSELATPEAFRGSPELVWEWYAWRRELIAGCLPNAAHETLVQMEQDLEDFVIITQNVDGLHQTAGSERVLELHGNIWRLRCTRCGDVREDRRVPLPDLPPHCAVCGSLLRPGVVWFGEPILAEIQDAAWSAAIRSKVMLVIGTSMVVEPAASLPWVAQSTGARLLEFNPRATPLSRDADRVLRGLAGRTLPRWWAAAAGDL